MKVADTIANNAVAYINQNREKLNELRKENTALKRENAKYEQLKKDHDTAFDWLLGLPWVQKELGHIAWARERKLLCSTQRTPEVWWLLEDYQSKKEWHEKRAKKSVE